MLKPIDKRIKPYDYYKLTILSQSQFINDPLFDTVLQLFSLAQVVEIDTKLIPLIEGTDNIIFYRPLFFKYIFIDTDLTFSSTNGTDKYLLKGMCLLDTGTDWIFNLILINLLTERDAFFYMCLIDDKKNAGALDDSNNISDFNEFECIRKSIRNFACNIVDMVEGNDADLEITTIKASKEQQEKRALRNKSILPTRVFIRPKKHFIKYLQEYNKSENLRLPPKYLVRGIKNPTAF